MNTDLIERAFYNMISNSFKARSKNIHIDLKYNRTALQLTISDDGYGINNEDKAELLSKFKKEPSLDFSSRGLGLGMLIIHAAAVAHNGTVIIADAEPRGCKITLTMDIQDNHLTLRQNTAIFPQDPLGGIDHMLIELAEFLPENNF